MLKKIYLLIMRILIGAMTPVIEQIPNFKLLPRVLISPLIKYPMKITSVLGIWKLN